MATMAHPAETVAEVSDGLFEATCLALGCLVGIVMGNTTSDPKNVFDRYDGYVSAMYETRLDE